jgi:hypothetical protein
MSLPGKLAKSEIEYPTELWVLELCVGRNTYFGPQRLQKNKEKY